MLLLGSGERWRQGLLLPLILVNLLFLLQHGRVLLQLEMVEIDLGVVAVKEVRLMEEGRLGESEGRYEGTVVGIQP